MYVYAVLSSLGDDVYEEPSTNLLEKHVAQLLGKDAALFVPSGSMSNQIALRSHLTQPPHSVLCDIRSHINRQARLLVNLPYPTLTCLESYEAGGAAYHSQAAVTAVIPSNGEGKTLLLLVCFSCYDLGHHLTLADVEKHVVTGSDVHLSVLDYDRVTRATHRSFSAPTRVIALENTLIGCIFPQDEIIKISQLAKSEGIRMHLDGARIWHVAAETGTPLSELCAPFDSVSCCFSKGLGVFTFFLHKHIWAYRFLKYRGTYWLMPGWKRRIHY
jgi:threonine aldolase